MALAELAGPTVGLAALNDVERGPRWHAVRGELLARAGRYAEAVAATTASMADELTEPERRYREGRIALWSAESAG